MAPSVSTAARRATATPQSRPSTRRPPLRIFEPEPRRSSRRSPSRRAHLWMAVGLVVASLLAVVVGDTLVAQGQVRLSGIQAKMSVLQATQKTMQTEVAQLAAPDRVVAQGIALGLTAPAQVVDLPQVPLDVPLPVPQTTPAAPLATASAAAVAATPSIPAASATGTSVPASKVATSPPTAATPSTTPAR